MQSYLKICNTCKLEKDHSCFYKASKEKDGLQYRCIECCKSYSKKYREENPEKELERHRVYLENNKAKRAEWEKGYREKNREKLNENGRKSRLRHLEKNLERCRKHSALNREQCRENTRIWREKNLEYARDYYRQYAKNNPGKVNAKTVKRKTLKMKAIPRWADKEKIDGIYIECSRISKETGILHHVDHIIPLQGKNVCGLHCETNLQIITATENLRKNNRL